MSNSVEMPPPGVLDKRRGRRWPLVLVALLLLVGAAVNLVPRIVERVDRGIGSLIGGLAQGVQQMHAVLEQTYALARHDVETSPEVAAALGRPLEFVPLEQVEWLDGSDNQLEFTFRVTGPRGTAQARARVQSSTDTGEYQLQSLKVDSDDGTILDLRQP